MSAEELQKKLKDAYVVSWAEPAPVLVAGLNCSAVMLHSTVLAVPAMANQKGCRMLIKGQDKV